MPETQSPGPLDRRAFLWLLLLFLFVPMVCCGGCSVLLSLWQGRSTGQPPEADEAASEPSE